ncbi:menaquinone biosynthesis protein [Paenibacillus terrigena]|uniref:menaquinone biosynthesis protein n=1 Tax=Paenibacillus terrigena TaxID=369333 RepID=UPI0003829599|nr:menaquinone biosynthesis protein [Paenibacillus terrigena]
MSSKSSSPIRIGEINYTNVWPVFYHFCPEQLRINVETTHQVPAQLNQAMLEGRIDLGPISSFAYGASWEKYVLFPDLSVSAFGPVRSILLFLKKPLEEVLHGTIALTNTSATSVNLLKIIIEKFYGGSPTYLVMDPSLPEMMEQADAALLIGDHAIRADWQHTDYEVMDLGERWNAFTGEWMTFAVWAVSRQVTENYPEEMRSILRAFHDSRERIKQDVEPIVRKATIEIGGTPTYWRRYFGGLCHDFGQSQQNGLELYFRYCKELGLIDKEVEICIWSDNTVTQVKE